MPTQAHSVKFTYEDFVLFPEDGKRHELIDGDHLMTPSPSTKHQRISINLSSRLKEYLRRSKAGEAFTAPMDVVFSEADVVEPDLLLVLSARRSIITEKNIQGAPDLAVEIISETTRKTDAVTKRKLYERYGVAEYWLVDPELESIQVYRMKNRAYARAAELSVEAKSFLATPLLPGFRLSLAEIFGA